MSNFTVIIPTHNRHNYICRSISYFRDLEADVIYCDSSTERYNGEIPENIKYCHLPNKKFAEKILFALNKINTDFVALCADDDFILIEALYKGVAFLSKNRNYGTVVGKYIAFKEEYDGNFYTRYNQPPKDIELSPTKNAEVFFQNYYQILWAMYDKKILAKSFRIINEAKFQNDNFIELVIGACACFFGGLKFLDELWGVRELHVTENWGTKHPTIVDLNDMEIQQDIQHFKNLIDQTTFVGYAELVLNNYLRFQNTKNKNSLILHIKKLIPNFLFNQLKKIKPRNNLEPSPMINLKELKYSNLNKISAILISNSTF